MRRYQVGVLWKVALASILYGRPHRFFETVEEYAYRATLESQLASVRGKMANHLKDLGL